MAILNGALDTRRESEELVEARFNAGLSNELDVARAKVELSNAQADLHEVKRQRNLLENSLATLTGKPPSALQLPVAAEPSSCRCRQHPCRPARQPAGAPSRPRVQRGGPARGQRASGRGRRRVLPIAAIDGQFRLRVGKLRDLAQGGSRQFSFGPLALSLPIFDGGRNQANLDLSKARYEEAVANHETKLLTALREVEDALSDVEQRQLQGDAQALSQAAAARAWWRARATSAASRPTSTSPTPSAARWRRTAPPRRSRPSACWRRCRGALAGRRLAAGRRAGQAGLGARQRPTKYDGYVSVAGGGVAAGP
jgi:multidrug efflux system outer membrane protein